MKFNLFIFLSFCFFSLFTLTAGTPHPELPAIQPNDQIVRHYAYTLSYVEEYEQPEWVAYMICRERAVSWLHCHPDEQ